MANHHLLGCVMVPTNLCAPLRQSEALRFVSSGKLFTVSKKPPTTGPPWLPPLGLLSRFVWAGQRLSAVIPCFRLIRGTGHGWQISGDRRDDQRAALKAMAGGADRAEADRARAILLTLGGWTSVRIAEAFGVREDTVRLWRSDFMSGGVGALKASVAPGPTPVKAAAALKVASPLLSAPVADRTNWTLARRRSQAARGSQSPDRSSPRCCAKKGFR
jgi:transposase